MDVATPTWLRVSAARLPLDSLGISWGVSLVGWLEPRLARYEANVLFADTLLALVQVDPRSIHQLLEHLGLAASDVSTPFASLFSPVTFCPSPALSDPGESRGDRQLALRFSHDVPGTRRFLVEEYSNKAGWPMSSH